VDFCLRIRQNIVCPSHWVCVAGAASLYLTQRGGKGQCMALAWRQACSPILAKGRPEDWVLGQNWELQIREGKTSLQYFPKLGHVQNMWMSGASPLLHLSQQGFTSGKIGDSLALDLWGSCTTLNCNQLHRARRDVELTSLKIKSHTSSNIERFRSRS